ncbi:Ankrd17 [Symbiodinium sp. CCMP2592]|nr:Ankrd17 [Symbiodinium sp. CCMP2592]
MAMPEGSAKMLRIWTASGREVVLAKDDVSDVRTLKQRLQSKFKLSRFRQRLVHDGRSLDDECAAVDLPDDLQLVLLSFSEASEEQALELITAAGHGNVASVEEILQRPQDPNRLVPDAAFPRLPHRSQTALACAACMGHREVVRLLLEASADKEGHGCFGLDRGCFGPALVLAACRGHLDVAHLLLEAGALKEATGTFYSAFYRYDAMPLIAAIEGNDGIRRQGGIEGPDDTSMKMVRLLLEAAANPNSSVSSCFVEHDARPLVAVCQAGHLEAARVLLEGSFAGDAGPAQLHLAPALVAAASGGHMEIARLLVQAAPPKLDACHNAMPQQRTSLSVLTPLFSAASWGHVGISDLLLKASAHHDKVCGDHGITALSAAAGKGHAETVRLLLGAAQGRGGNPGKTADELMSLTEPNLTDSHMTELQSSWVRARAKS